MRVVLYEAKAAAPRGLISTFEDNQEDNRGRCLDRSVEEEQNRAMPLLLWAGVK